MKGFYISNCVFLSLISGDIQTAVFACRVRKMGEILAYIRTIKMYAWEKFFSDKVMESRKEEVKYLGVSSILFNFHQNS